MTQFSDNQDSPIIIWGSPITTNIPDAIDYAPI